VSPAMVESETCRFLLRWPLAVGGKKEAHFTPHSHSSNLCEVLVIHGSWIDFPPRVHHEWQRSSLS